MAEREEHLLDHEYDGIREYDNPLPRWWVWIFWATIVFSAAYFANLAHIRGPGRIAEYEQDMAAFRARQPAEPAGAPTVAALDALVKDKRAVDAGKATFVSTCAPCHRADGGGLIGPNLTDDYWLHGGTITEVYATVHDGVPDKGMPTWGKTLKPEQVAQVVAYVWTLHGTNPPNPKAPQGVLVPR